MRKNEWTEDEIKNKVRARYAGIIKSLGENICCSGGLSCCEPRKSQKNNPVSRVDYSQEDMDSIPDGAACSSLGCGNPMAFSEIRAGQTVVDIGSGAGLDCFLAADRVGKTGSVIGVDMTSEMIERARANAVSGGYTQVEFRLGEAEALPVENGSVDWIVSNCVINLSPDKPLVFQEIARILKPGGRFSIFDIVLGDNLPQEITGNIHAWTGCVAGAIRESEYIEGLKGAGLKDVKVVSRIVYTESQLQSILSVIGLSDRVSSGENLIRTVQGKVWSAQIQGRK
jgi:SAM-dependent methyltransferase